MIIIYSIINHQSYLMNQMDIKITEISKQPFKGLQSSKLILGISGKQVNSSVVNTLRRLTYDYVPTYAFDSSSITIEKNTSIYNNDMMRERLIQLTIPNISTNIKYLDDQYFMNVDFNDPNRPRDPHDKLQIELYINVVNNGSNVMKVTTSHAKLFIGGVEEDITKKFDHDYPILLIELRPGEVFSARCVGILATGRLHSVWNAAANTFYKEINDNAYEMTVESSGQMTEYDILTKACSILKTKMVLLKEYIRERYETPDILNTNNLLLILDEEDHTIGNIVNECLQDHDGVLVSGLSKPNLLINSMHIKFRTIKPNPLVAVYEVIEYIIKLYDNIKKQLRHLDKGMGSKVSNSSVKSKPSSLRLK